TGGDRGADSGDEIGAVERVGKPGQAGPDLGQPLELAANRRVTQRGLDLGRLRPRDLALQISGERPRGWHPPPPGHRGSSRSRSCASASKSRRLTVPSGNPSTSAISWYGSSPL